MKLKVREFRGDERIGLQTLNRDAVVLDGLQAVKKEETGLNFDLFALDLKFVAAVVDLPNKFTHFEAVERGNAAEEFVKYDSKRPRVD